MLSDIRARVRGDLYRAKQLLRRAFSENHTTKEVAQSFSLGVFITMLPTLGVGFVVFLVLATLFDRMSKLALIASAIVFNPAVKWGVYGASLGLGLLLLGPVEGIAMSDASLAAAPDVVVRLVVGNVILAVIAAVPSYFVAYRFVDKYAEFDFVGAIRGHLPFVGRGNARSEAPKSPPTESGAGDPSTGDRSE